MIHCNNVSQCDDILQQPDDALQQLFNMHHGLVEIEGGVLSLGVFSHEFQGRN